MRIAGIANTPFHIQAEVTTRCNASCTICPRSYGIAGLSREEDMTFEEFARILGQFQNLKSIHLQGLGEPLLNRDIFRIIMLCKKRRLSVSTTTNGSLLTRDVCEQLVSSGIDRVCISIDTMDERKFQDIRRGLDLKTVVDNVSTLCKTRDKMGHSTPDLEIQAVGMKYNVEDLVGVTEFGIGIGASHVRILDLCPHGHGLATEENSLTNADPVKLKRVLTRCEYLCAEQNVRFDRPVFSPSVNTRAKEACDWPFGKCYVTVDGHVTPCCFLTNPDVESFGNLLQEPLRDIWNSKGYENLRYRIINGDLPQYCKDCQCNPLPRRQ